MSDTAGNPALPPALAMPVEPFTDDELAEAVEAVLNGDEKRMPARVRSFEIDTLPKAEWAMRKLAAVHDKKVDVQDTAAAWHQQIDEWMQGELDVLEPRLAIFAAALEVYGRNCRADDDRTATIKLPSGSIKTRKGKQATVHVANGAEEKVLAWCLAALDMDEYDAVIKTSPRVLVSELRKVVDVVPVADGYRIVHKRTGEMVPGVYARAPGQIDVTVEPK